MSEVLQANIFFVIASIGVVLFTILACIALYHVVKILRSVRRIIDRIEQGSESLSEDIKDLRAYFREGSLISRIVGMFVGQRMGRRGAKRTKGAAKNGAEDDD